jgi:hypothetical protein
VVGTALLFKYTIGMPTRNWMFNRVPAVITLAR